MGLYDIPDGLQHEYKSATCTVYIADRVEDDKRTRVALKFMQHADEFEREEASRELLLSSGSGQERMLQDYIIDTTDRYHCTDAAFQDAVKKRGRLVDYDNPCLLVMPAADRNLRVIMDSERITKPEVIKGMFHEIAKCVEFMHERGCIHGDLKPRNLMRIIRDLKRLITAWNSPHFAPGLRNVLPGDASTIDAPDDVVHHRSWRALISSDGFGADVGSTFHIGLLPMPYLGNLRKSRVFLCSLNPGLGPHDYFGELHVPEYRKALLKNLRQDRDARFPFLDPAHAWHGGSAYWAPRLRSITEGVEEGLKIGPREAREVCAEHIAVLELVPYHSGNFKLKRRGIDALESTNLIRNFVFSELLPRHRDGDCKLIVLRSRDLWLRPGVKASGFPVPAMPRNAYIADRDARGARNRPD
jgi:hypothetical protein